MPPLLIEFIGLPGAGKTTIAQQVTAELKAVGYRCFSLSTLDSPEEVKKKKGNLFQKLRTFYGLVVSVTRYNDIAFKAIRYAFHIRPRSSKSFQRLMILLVRLDFVRTILNEDVDIVLLDQGLLQNIWSIATTGEPPDNDKYLKQLTESVLKRFSPLVVGIRIEASAAAERITLRRTKRSRFDEMPPETTRPIFTKYNIVLTEIIDVVENIDAKKLLNINGSQALAKSASLIFTFIKKAGLGIQTETENQNEESTALIGNL